MESEWSNNTWIWSIGPTSASLSARFVGFEPDVWMLYNNEDSGYVTAARFAPVTVPDDHIFFVQVPTFGLRFPYGYLVHPDVHT